jgi:hypothetical protein
MPRGATSVKLRNELQNVRVSDRNGRAVEGVVRVRGVEARLGARGVVVEMQEPVAVVVHTPSGVQRLALPRYDALPRAAAAIAGPALFLAARQFFRKGRRR